MSRPLSVSRLLWLWAVLLTPDLTVRAIHHCATDPAAHNLIYLYSAGGYDDGMLNWQECAQCRRGVIAKISLVSEWQRHGIGRLLLGRVLAGKGAYTWVTSGQSPDGKQFFAAITAETGIAFAERGATCPHMTRLGRTSPSRARVLIRLSYACHAALYDRRN